MKRSTGAVGVIVAVSLLMSGCAAEASSESGEDRTTPLNSVESGGASADKDPDLLPLISEAALDPCPPGTDNPDAAIPGLPQVTFRCLGHGPDVDLSTIRGTPLVINVWASWCPPCIAEMPILTAAAAELRGEVQFLGVDIQDQDSSALMMLRDFGADFPSVVDPVGEVRGLLAVSGPPVTFFVNEQGVIKGRHNGSIPSTEYFDALLKRYLGVHR